MSYDDSHGHGRIDHNKLHSDDVEMGSMDRLASRSADPSKDDAGIDFYRTDDGAADAAEDSNLQNDHIPDHNNNNTANLGRLLYPNEDDLQRKLKLFDPDHEQQNKTRQQSPKADEVETDMDIDSDVEPEPTEKHIASIAHDRSCQIEFENESTINIYCYWLQYDGNIRNPPHVIFPSSSLRLNTYITHPFIMSTSESLNAANYDTIIAVYIPTNARVAIHHVLIDENLAQVHVEEFHEDIKPRCKCGRVLHESTFGSDADDKNLINDECFGCGKYIADGDRIWVCDNTEVHVVKVYCLQCAQHRSNPMAIITAYASDVESDYCCNERYQNYPRNYPRLFQTHQFAENLLRVLSLTADLVLLYVLIDNLMNTDVDTAKLTTVNILRIVFTLLPGLLLMIAFLIMYQVQNGCLCTCDDDASPTEKRKECLKIACMLLLLFSLIFLSKLLMIGLCVFRIYFVLKTVKHGKQIPSDIEIKHVLFLYPLLYDAMISSWPLLIISMHELVSFDTVTMYSANKLHYLALMMKVISCGILLFVDMDRLRLWRYSFYDAQMFVAVCSLHATRPYPLRASKIAAANNNNNSETPMHVCVICGEACGEYVWFCAHSECRDNQICMECAWSYLAKYQQLLDCDDEAFYQQLLVSTHFIAIYRERIEQYAQTNHLGEGQKHCWSSLGGWLWTAKLLYNVFQCVLLLIGVWICQKIWFSVEIDGVDELERTDRDRLNQISTIYASLLLLPAFALQCVLLIIQCTYLFPGQASKIQKSVPRTLFNLFLVFYLLAFSLFLFDFSDLAKLHIVIKAGLIGFVLQLLLIPLLAIWQMVQSNAYLFAH